MSDDAPPRVTRMVFPAPLSWTESIRASVRISTPSLRSAAATTSAASASSLERMRGALSITVTRAPKRTNACASSHPIGPPPMTARCSGRSVSEKMVSLVRHATPPIPSIGGMAARAPVAITARWKRRRRPSTSTASAATKRPPPRNTSTPISSRKRAALSAELMSARIRRIRSITAAKSPSPDTAGPWKRADASRAACHARAAARTALEGTHPTFRQSPPISSRSTSATRAPSAAPIAAVTSPAVPAPITTRW
jgi:hypothetical protein